MKQFLARCALLLGLALFILSLTSLNFLSTHVSEAINALNGLGDRQPLLLAIAFITLYVLIATMGLPGGAVMSLTAGYFFGFAVGFVLVMLSILAALTLTWRLIKASGVRAQGRSFALYQRISEVISESPYQILLFIRFIPVAPFYLVNLLAASSGVSFRIYALTGFLGLIPSSIAFTLIGQGIGESLLENDISMLSIITHPMVLYPSLLLALLALTALVWKRVLSR